MPQFRLHASVYHWRLELSILGCQQCSQELCGSHGLACLLLSWICPAASRTCVEVNCAVPSSPVLAPFRNSVLRDSASVCLASFACRLYSASICGTSDGT